MGKIDTGCAGCYYLTNPLIPQCNQCVNHNTYTARPHNYFGVEKEMEMLSVRFEPLAVCDIVKTAQAKYDQNIFDIIRRERSAYQRQRERERRVLEKLFEYKNRLKIEKVIFNDPATIVYWRDGSKTVFKADGEAFDPEKGLAMAISKKALGNEGNYYDTFTKWLKESEETEG